MRKEVLFFIFFDYGYFDQEKGALAQKQEEQALYMACLEKESSEILRSLTARLTHDLTEHASRSIGTLVRSIYQTRQEYGEPNIQAIREAFDTHPHNIFGGNTLHIPHSFICHQKRLGIISFNGSLDVAILGIQKIGKDGNIDIRDLIQKLEALRIEMPNI